SCYDQQDRVVLQCGRSVDSYDVSLCGAASPSCTRSYKYSYDETSNISGATNLGKGKLTTVIGTWTTIKYLYDIRGRVLRQDDIYQGGTKTTSFQFPAD